MSNVADTSSGCQVQTLDYEALTKWLVVEFKPKYLLVCWKADEALVELVSEGQDVYVRPH